MFNFKKYQEIQGFIRKHQKISKIVAISKNHPKESVIEALKHGVRIFGENRVQEAKIKFVELFKEYPNLELHFTGTLQTNKVKSALQIFQVFQTIDREKLANEFQKFPNLTKDKKFLIQVNTGKEKQKSGILPNLASEFIQHCIHALKLNVIGLMCLPPTQDDPRPHFLMLKELAFKNKLKQLSMGMSTDYKIAVDSGATFIRIGSSFFGDKESAT